jgi:hypothetical protein
MIEFSKIILIMTLIEMGGVPDFPQKMRFGKTWSLMLTSSPVGQAPASHRVLRALVQAVCEWVLDFVDGYDKKWGVHHQTYSGLDG